MDAGECGEDEYLMLKDVRIRLDRDVDITDEEGFVGFSLCLWIYLPGPARPSSVIIRQISEETEDEFPFLSISEENKLVLFPLMFLLNEASSSNKPYPWSGIPHITSETEFPMERWVHVGCMETTEYICLYFNGELAGCMSVSSSSVDHNILKFKRVTLAGCSGINGKLHGYVYNTCVLPLSASIYDEFAKKSPVKLSLNGSCALDALEVGSDGVLSIVGGKASCRRNFTLDVILLDAAGQTAHNDMEIIASLIYADNGAPVEKACENSEGPLLVTYEGIEYSSTERPVALFLGRASFKLKISQLSSRSDNRLFCICFRASRSKCYPFFETFSPPIRCISRNRCVRPIMIGKRKRLASPVCEKRQRIASPICEITPSPEINDRCQTTSCGNGYPDMVIKKQLANDFSSKHSNSRQLHGNGSLEQDKAVSKMSFEAKSNNVDGTDSCPSDSESIDAGSSEANWGRESIDTISDVVIFRYCLEGTYERSLLLKEIIKSWSNDELINFAKHVCLYSGCLHHRYPILISKQLVQEGNDTWNSICQNGNRALWTTTALEINKRFMSISRSTTRGLSEKDLEVLRGIAGCGEELGSDSFSRMWQWFYPVAVALSNVQIITMWESTLPKWIEGFITMEEAELSLKSPRGIQKPGTFVLRFPTSRSWPHPDAGSLVVTYIGSDFSIHHKLLSIDCSKETGSEMIQNMLLKEPELSQLGRVIR